MRRTLSLSTSVAALLLLMVVAAGAQKQQESRRPVAPMLTNEDVLSPTPSHPGSEEGVSRTTLSGSPVRNPRGVLESVLNKMSEVNSVRTRMQIFVAEGRREIMIESIKPDRMHVTTPYGEMITIGNKFYAKKTGAWELTAVPRGAAQSDAGFDFRTLVKQMIAKSSVHITGQIVGSQIIDDVDTVAYEFAVTDGTEAGTIQVSVGKADGFIRRIAVSGPSVNVKVWFTNLNEQFSIEPPM